MLNILYYPIIEKKYKQNYHRTFIHKITINIYKTINNITLVIIIYWSAYINNISSRNKYSKHTIQTPIS